MKIPESVRIGGVEYAISYVENLRYGNQLAYGHIDYDNCKIELSATDGTGHQKRCQTLLHEILHGIRQHAGLEIKNEEAVIEMFAKGKVLSAALKRDERPSLTGEGAVKSLTLPPAYRGGPSEEKFFDF